jgi:hypothetical protein
MESSSSQAFDSDESQCLLNQSYDDHDYIEDDIPKDIDICISEDCAIVVQSTEISSSIDNKTVTEPHTDMEFNTREEARDFYISYGRRRGFTVRTHHNRRSRIDNIVIGQEFVCSKEGFREKKYVTRKDRVLPPPPTTREGCNAMMRVAFSRLRDGGKWVVTKFVKDHNHTLLSPNKVPWRACSKSLISQDEKDQRIRELTLELHNEKQRCKRRCTVYKEQICSLLKYVEEHTDGLSRSVQDIVKNVKEFENKLVDDSD